MNSTCNTFESLDFNQTDWSCLCTSIKSVIWKALLHECVPSKYLSIIIQTLVNLCSIHVPAKRSKKNSVSQSKENFDEEEIKTIKKIPYISFYLLTGRLGASS